MGCLRIGRQSPWELCLTRSPLPLFSLHSGRSLHSHSAEKTPRGPLRWRLPQGSRGASSRGRRRRCPAGRAWTGWTRQVTVLRGSEMLSGGGSAVGRLLSPSYHQSEWGCAHLGQLGHQVTGSLTQHTVYKAGMLPMWAVCLLRPARQWAGGFRSLGCTAPLQLPVVCGQEQVSY